VDAVRRRNLVRRQRPGLRPCEEQRLAELRITDCLERIHL
jgi:hypothetical protein